MVDTSLFDMKVAGTRDLPAAAAVYSMVTANLAMSNANESEAFDPETPEVYEAWNALRNEVQTLYADISDYLYRAGNALVLVAEDLAATDKDAADQLKERESAETYDDYKPEVPAPFRPENSEATEADRGDDRDDDKYGRDTEGDKKQEDPAWANKPNL